MFSFLRSKPKEVLVRPHFNVPERFHHSETILKAALDLVLGTEFETEFSRRWRGRFEILRRECYFLEPYPDFCAQEAWISFYQEEFDKLIEEFRESLPKGHTYSQSDLVTIVQELLMIQPNPEIAQTLALLLPFPPCPIPFSEDGILIIARALYSALPPCSHFCDPSTRHLWHCRILEGPLVSTHIAGKLGAHLPVLRE